MASWLRLPALGALAATAFVLAALPAAAKDCRARAVPPGVRAPVPAGCAQARPSPVPAPEAPGLRARGERGVVVLENGTEIRIRGRVRAESIGGR